MYFNTDYWRSHDKGHQTRQKILGVLTENPHATHTEISNAVGVKVRQVKRQLHKLHTTGELKIHPQNAPKILNSLIFSGILIVSFWVESGVAQVKIQPSSEDMKLWQKSGQVQPKPQIQKQKLPSKSK